MTFRTIMYADTPPASIEWLLRTEPTKAPPLLSLVPGAPQPPREEAARSDDGGPATDSEGS